MEAIRNPFDNREYIETSEGVFSPQRNFSGNPSTRTATYRRDSLYHNCFSTKDYERLEFLASQLRICPICGNSSGLYMCTPCWNAIGGDQAFFLATEGTEHPDQERKRALDDFLGLYRNPEELISLLLIPL